MAVAGGVPAAFQGFPLTFGFVPLAGGSYVMRSSAVENAPLREVSVAPFAISEKLVTVDEYEFYLEETVGPAAETIFIGSARKGVHPSKNSSPFGAFQAQMQLLPQPAPQLLHLRQDPSLLLHPRVELSRKEAMKFCVWKAERISRLSGAMFTGRLATPEEWEFAARAGVAGEHVYGTDTGALEPRDSTPSGWNIHCSRSISLHGTVPVGAYAPNAFGLYDMGGLVLEWTSATQNMSLYSSDEYAVVCGSAWGSRNPNVAHRIFMASRWGYKHIGFRVVLVPKEP